MPSTARKTLKDLFRAFARSATISLDKAESQLYNALVVSLDAATAQAELPVFMACGAVYVKNIWFVPTATAAGHATDHAHFIVKAKGAAGDGTTAVTTYVTTLSPDNGFVAFVPKAIYAPVSPGYAVANGQALSLEITKGGNGIALSGYVVVEYTPIID